MKEVTIPVAYCPICEKTGPVVIRDIKPNEWSEDLIDVDITIVFCPACEEIINTIGDLEIKWYTPEELTKATGWKIKDD